MKKVYSIAQCLYLSVYDSSDRQITYNVTEDVVTIINEGIATCNRGMCKDNQELKNLVKELKDWHVVIMGL